MPFELLGVRDRDNLSYRDAGSDLTKRAVEVFQSPGNPVPITFSAINLTTATIFNVTTVLANTEYSQALPANTKEILIRCRQNARTRFTFTSGDTSTLFIEIPAGASFTQGGLLLASSTIYFETNLAGGIIEILAWT